MGITNCIKYALEKLGAEIPVDLKWCIGPPLQESFQKLLSRYPDKTYEEGVRLFRIRFEQQGMYENKVYEGIEDLLCALKSNGRNMLIATSKPHLYAKKIIQHFGLSNFFSQIYGSELNGTRRDKSELISYLLKNEGLLPANTVMVGDRMHDLIGARKNGIRAIGVAWGYGSLEELKAEKPIKICNTPENLKEILLKA